MRRLSKACGSVFMLLALSGSVMVNAEAVADTQAGSDDGNVNTSLVDVGATSVITGTAGPDNLTGICCVKFVAHSFGDRK